VRSVAKVVCVGRDDAEVARRAHTPGRGVDEVLTDGIAGTPAQAVDALGRWREQAGVTRVYLQLTDLGDLDQVEPVAAEVAPQPGS
jgi:alkanesulfonate monooxygenase